MEFQDATYWIKRLALNPHPEGGYYREVFRSGIEIRNKNSEMLKQACTSIYYLLSGGDFSAFHRLKSDEIWYFHSGEPLLIHSIDSRGTGITQELSGTSGGALSIVIEGGRWFAAEMKDGTGFALVSCVVAPAFDFSEFEMAAKESLSREFPGQASLIERLCRG